MTAAGRRLTWLDVFAGRALEGNQLAVVHDADDLDDATMLRFARETNLSETTFVQTPSVAGADYRNRIFTPLRELPFAGHPSLGTLGRPSRLDAAMEDGRPRVRRDVVVVADGTLHL